MAGPTFDDLVPNSGKPAGALSFDDLVPAKSAQSTASAPAAAPPAVPNTMLDTGAGFAAGVPRGAIETAMFPATASNLLTSGSDWLADHIVGGVRGALGYPALDPKDTAQGRDRSGTIGAGIDAAQGAVRGAMDRTLYSPKTTPGKFAETVGEFVLPGGGPSKVARGAETVAGKVGRYASELAQNVALPGIASEAAGQVTDGTALEPYARVAGALAGNAVTVLPKAYNAPEAVVRRAVGPVDNVDWERAAKLQDNSTGVRLSGPEAIAQAQGGASALPDVLRVVEGSVPGRQVTSPFFSARQGQVDTAVTNLLDLIAPQSKTPTELGPTVARAAEAALQKGPEGQALVDMIMGVGPRMTDMQAGSVIQPELRKVFEGRDNMRDALADQAYGQARRSAPTIPVDELPVSSTVTRPSYTRLDPGENPITGTGEMQPTAVPAQVQTPSMVSRTGPDLIQVDPRPVLKVIDQLNVDARAGTQGVLQDVRKMLFRDGGVDSSISGMEKTRGAIGDMITSAKQTGQMQQVEYLRQVQRSLDDTLASVPEYARANDTFKAASEPLAPFENTGAGKVIARDEFNKRFVMNPEDVPGALSKPSDLRTFGNVASPEAMNAMQSNITTRLLDGATDASGKVSVDRLTTAIRDNADVLDQMPDVRARLIQVMDSASGLDAARANTPLGKIASSTTTESAAGALMPKQPHVGSEGEAANTLQRLTAEDPDAAAQLVRQELADRYAQSAKDTQSGSHETAGIKFRNSIAGSPPQDALLQAILQNLPSKAAMEAAPELLDVLQATGRRKPMGSPTDANAAIRGDLSAGSPGHRIVNGVRSLGATLMTNAGKVADRNAYNRNMVTLADLFTDPNSVGLIRDAARRTPKMGFAELLTRTGVQAPVTSEEHSRARQ